MMKERGVFNYIAKSKLKKGVVTEKYLYDLVDDLYKLEKENKNCGCSLCISQDEDNLCEGKCPKILGILREKFEHNFFICPVRYFKDQNLKKLYEDEPIDFEINTIDEEPGTDI